jgi:hypothetical protein
MLRWLTVDADIEPEQEGSGGASLRPRPFRVSFVLYLAAVAMLPFKWLSPFSYQQAGWTDVLMALAVVVWVIEHLAQRPHFRLRAPHYLLVAYVVAVALSATLSADKSTAGQNVLIGGELVAMWVLTSDFARSAVGRRAIGRVVFGISIVAAIEAAFGLLLFYLGDSTSLVAGYSSYFKASDLYTRVQAGFYSPALLGSFCVFASAILAMPDAGLSRRTRLAGQVLLGMLVVTTLSRPAIAFALAISIRGAHRRGTVRARRYAALCLAIGGALLAALSLAPLALDPVRPASSSAGANPRWTILKSSVHSIVEHPVLGSGPGALTGRWQGDRYRAHDTPVNIAAATGLPSLAAVIALVALLWRRRRRPTNVPLWSGLVALGIDGLTQDIEHFRHVWIALGMADADRAEDEGSEHRRPGLWIPGPVRREDVDK